MYHEDVADECSADEEKEEPDRRQRRAVTTPPVLTLADAGTPGDVVNICRHKILRKSVLRQTFMNAVLVYVLCGLVHRVDVSRAGSNRF